MSPWTGVPMVDAVAAVADLLARYPTPRTGQPLASAQNPPAFTIYAGRQASVSKILANLPALVVDVNAQQAVEYEQDDSTIFAMVPLSIVAIVPSFAADPELNEDGRDQAAQAADLDIKTVYADLEQLIWVVRGQALGPVRALEFDAQSPGVLALEGDAAGGLKSRLCQLDLWARLPLGRPNN